MRSVKLDAGRFWHALSFVFAVNNGETPANPTLPAGGAAPAAPGPRADSRASLRKKCVALLDHPIPAGFSTDPELVRRARLITRFGLLGSLFGIVYAIFYLLIGHRWGATIIFVCSSAFAVAPLLLLRSRPSNSRATFLC